MSLGRKIVNTTNHPLTCVTSLNFCKHLGCRGKDSTSIEKETGSERLRKLPRVTQPPTSNSGKCCWLSVFYLTLQQMVLIAGVQSLEGKVLFPTLTGVAQWVGRLLAKQKVTGSVPSQGTCLGCGFGPSHGVCERQPIDVSLPLFLLPFLPL